MNSFRPDQADVNTLQAMQSELQQQYNELKAAGLNLDLTRGKPSTAQLELSCSLDGILEQNFLTDSGEDTRNYGGLDGLPQMKAFAAEILEVSPANILVGGNSSLTLMYQSVLFAHIFGLEGPDSAWQKQSAKFLCPVPGYDRHFSICEELGIEMIPVAMNENGPDMDEVEKLIKSDPQIKGIWCVPRFSNPTGIVYSDEVVARMAALGKIAAADFRIFWDNAYVVHDFEADAPRVKSLLEEARKAGTEDSVLMFGSTSKVTLAGAGVAFMAASTRNLDFFKKHLAIASIGPDKVNQLRHLKFFGDLNGLHQHMQKHAQLLKPRFDAVLNALDSHFRDSDAATWTRPLGGYFVSVDTRPGLARQVVSMAADLGVKLTPAGATFPYRKDPEDRNIRIAPSFPTIDDITKAMDVFVLCIKLATVKQLAG